MQSLFQTRAGEEARLQLYVDDPIIALRGAEARRRRLASKFVAVFLVLGFPLAFSKAQRGQCVVWIGVTFEVRKWEIECRIPYGKLQELEEMILGLLKSNVAPVKAVRSLGGNATNISTIIYVWRPFLRQIWTAIAAFEAGETGSAPRQCLWTKQILVALHWLLAFIRGQQGVVCRIFNFNCCYGLTAPVKITCDASVWGIGGWISFGDTPIGFFHDIISPDDAVVLGHERGEKEGQQAFEGLALLVAVRLWAPLWKSKRVHFTLRSDNVGALTIFSALKTSSEPMNLIAR